MAQLKTQPNDASVEDFLVSVADEKRREDCRAVMAIMEDVTGEKPVMWGDSIVGYGLYRYRYKSGREGEWFVAGLSPRKQALTIYVMAGFKRFDDLLASLGRHTTGRSCLYVKKLEDIDLGVLRTLITESVAHVSSTSIEA